MEVIIVKYIAKYGFQGMFDGIESTGGIISRTGGQGPGKKIIPRYQTQKRESCQFPSMTSCHIQSDQEKIRRGRGRERPTEIRE